MHTTSVQFRSLFVLRVLFAPAAIFIEVQFLRRVELIAFRDVIGRFTDRADETQK